MVFKEKDIIISKYLDNTSLGLMCLQFNIEYNPSLQLSSYRHRNIQPFLDTLIDIDNRSLPTELDRKSKFFEQDTFGHAFPILSVMFFMDFLI